MTLADTASDLALPTQSIPDLMRRERCDRCGANAQVLLSLPRSGGQGGSFPLGFCRHHYMKHELELFSQGATIKADIRESLTARETADHA